MRKYIVLWQLAGFLFTSVAGTLLHFLFDWSGGNVLAALVSAVNESIWEHMKLLFFPMVTFAIIEYFNIGGQLDHFWCAKLAGILVGLALIPVLYYTYTGILGVSADWLNIAIFYVAVAAAFWTETQLLEMGSCHIQQGFCVGTIALIGLAFIVLTFLTPRIPFFQDPVTGSYGYSSTSTN